MIFVQKEIKAVYLGNNKVRPSGWKPGANTIAYYPLTSVSQLQDMSGNNHTLTNNSNLVSFGTYGGVNCAYFPGNSANYLYVNNPTYLPSGNAVRTMSIWGYFVGSTSVDSPMMFWGEWWTYELCGLFVYSGGVYFAGYSADTSRYTFSSNAWHLVTMTYDGTNIKLYLDGSIKETKSAALSTTTPLFGIGGNGSSSRYWNGYLSDAIVESKVWTYEEISDYYNSKKSKYGL